MTLEDALKKLGIEDYGDRIFKSNSHGELSHLADYCWMAELGLDAEWFRPRFLEAIEMAAENWSRPESVFQHIPRIFDSWATGKG